MIYPLNATQRDMLGEADAETLVTHYAVNRYVAMPREKVDADAIAAACQRVLDEIRYTHIHLVRTAGGEVMISTDTDMPNNVQRFYTTDAEWERDKQQFIRPFQMDREAGVRLSVVQTETLTILMHEYCHLFFDGYSMKILFNFVCYAYEGRELVDQSDIAGEWALKEIASYSSENYQRAKQSTIEKFRGMHYTDICRTTDNPWGDALLAISKLTYKRIVDGSKAEGAFTLDMVKQQLTPICTAAYALALGRMADADEVVFTTTLNGRTDKSLHGDVIGNFLNSQNLKINLSPEQTVGELIRQTRTELFGLMRRLIYPWIHQMRDLGIPTERQAGTEMNVSGTAIYEYNNIGGKDYPALQIEPKQTRTHIFLVVQLREDGLTFNVEGSSALYTQEQLARLARLTGEYTLCLVGPQQRQLKDIHLR